MSGSRLVFAALIALFFVPAIDCEAQKLKLPNLLPFKKQRTEEVKPFQLTDQSAGQFRLLPQKPLFDFRKQGQQTQAKAGPLADFNNRSKAFFSKAGKGITQFAEDTKQALVDGWNPPKAHTAWWNEGPKLLPNQPMFTWPGREASPPESPLMPRMTEEYRNNQPRHRF